MRRMLGLVGLVAVLAATGWTLAPLGLAAHAQEARPAIQPAAEPKRNGKEQTASRSEAPSQAADRLPPDARSTHTLALDGRTLRFTATAGSIPITNSAGRMLAETKLFNAEQVVAEMGAAGGGCNLVILDACRNTPVARDPSARDAVRGGLAEMKPPAGSLIAFATDAGHTALDGEGRNGLYTGELVKHLQTPGITIEQVFKRLNLGGNREALSADQVHQGFAGGAAAGLG